MPHIEIKPELDDLDSLNLDEKIKEKIKAARLEAADCAQSLALLSDHALSLSEVEVRLKEWLVHVRDEMSIGREMKKIEREEQLAASPPASP